MRCPEMPKTSLTTADLDVGRFQPFLNAVSFAVGGGSQLACGDDSDRAVPQSVRWEPNYPAHPRPAGVLLSGSLRDRSFLRAEPSKFGVRHNHRDSLVENVPHRNPISSCALHNDREAVVSQQPVQTAAHKVCTGHSGIHFHGLRLVMPVS